MMTFAIVQLFLSVFLKGLMKDLMGLFFTLQIICYLVVYDVPIPSNAEIFQQQLISLVEFEMLKPKGFLAAFWPEFDLMAWIAGQKERIVSQDQEASVLSDLEFFIFVVVMGLLFLLILLILKNFRKCKKKVNRVMINFRKGFIWNGFIKSQMISYIQTCITICVQFRLFLKGSPFRDPSSLNTSMALLVVVVAFPIWGSYILTKHKHRL